MGGESPEGRFPAPDDVPKDHLFAQPLRVARLTAEDPEPVGDGRIRVVFAVRVVDADGRGCGDLAVGARIEGPERTGEGEAHTDPFGEVFFRMVGPPGTYRCEIRHVSAGALDVEQPEDGPIAAAEAVVGPAA